MAHDARLLAAPSRPVAFTRIFMPRRPTLFALTILLLTLPLRAENWPCFRGPSSQGVSTETNLPLTWSKTEHLAWSTDVPGTGWSSPIVWEKRVFVTSTLENG